MTQNVRMEVHVVHQMCVTASQGMWVTAVRQVSFNAAILQSIKTYFCFPLAVCDPECQNGGTCSAPDVCDCATGYMGDSCQTGEF